MNINAARDVLETIKKYDKIIIFRHFRPDGDAVGSTKGLGRILQLSFPEKEVILQNCDFSDYLAFLGAEDDMRDDEYYKDALGIVIDTATAARVSNQKFSLCREVIKIDHHIDVEAYGNLNWVEEERSSACELIAAFYYALRDELKIDSEGATYLYTGMVTDSGRFKYEGVTGDTMRCAATLLDVGVDTQTLFARLYLEAFEYLKFKAHIYQRMQITENGVAYIYIDKAMQEEFGLTLEQASACVGNLDSIRGCIVWLALIENGDEDHSIRVRLRSRFVHINPIAEKYHGGGHACASGATVYSLEEMESLLKDADALVKEYKETHEDWL